MTKETLKTYRLSDWLKGLETLKNLGFTVEEIEKAITDSGNNIDTLTDINGFQTFPQYLTNSVYEVVHTSGFSYMKTEYTNAKGKTFKHDEIVRGMGIRQPAQYQGLKHGAILFCLFKNKWSWFDSFTFTKECSIKTALSSLPINQIPAEYQHMTAAELRYENIVKKELQSCSRWDIYEIGSEKHFEIYLKCGENKGANGIFNTSFDSLYVPIEALVNSDFSIIEERMKSYWGWYNKTDLSGYALNHRGRTEEQYLKDQQAAHDEKIALLDSEEGKQLKAFLNN